MIGVRTIRFRLTAAYALILTVLVGGTAVWAWVGVSLLCSRVVRWR